MIYALVAIALAIICDCWYFPRPPLANVPTFYGWPPFGTLFWLQKNPAKTLQKWAKHHGLIQVKVGFLWIVVALTDEEVHRLWVSNASKLNLRWLLPVFSSVLTVPGFTVGSTPHSAELSATKRHFELILHAIAVSSPRFVDVVTAETDKLVRQLMEYVNDDVDPLLLFKRWHLRIVLALGYGIDADTKFPGLIDDIITTEQAIMRIRAPLLWRNWFPGSQAARWIQRRGKYMDMLMKDMLLHVNERSDSVVGQLLDRNLSMAQVSSCCLLLVSAGLDNTPLLMCHLLGQMGYHRQWQARAYDEISSKISGVRDYRQGVVVMALIQETLRLFSVLPLALPRQTTGPIGNIPPNTKLLMNAYTANHDPKRYANADEFDPQRWLDDASLRHYGFGTGLRSCLGKIMASRMMWWATVRVLDTFAIDHPHDTKFKMGLDPFATNASPSATSFEPYPFKVHLTPRSNENAPMEPCVIAGNKAMSPNL